MTGEMDKIKTVFLEAVENYGPNQWRPFLDDACGGDEELRRHVEVLLEAHADGRSLLDHGAFLTAETTSQAAAEQLGSRIGPYKLLQQIGEGGFGVVFMAEQQQPVKRKVALKIIKPGMDTKQVIARFEAERQALAMMDHPNIARVFDGGATESGRPYFVMELVKGIPLTAYCDQQRLTLEQRLRLFLPICQAVHHAHQKAVIHRDLKPSNVLVAIYDGEPVPKVIDFGVAKATNQQLTERTMFTQYGQVLGTLEYMSPEQAELNQLDIDVRSDVYSLGIILYELISGTTPLQVERLREAGYAEILRLIREEDAPRLSARLSTMGHELTVAAKHRGVEASRLQQIVHGELDWIVLRALEKERGRRYQSSGALFADIERYLKNEPVEACPPSRTYQVKKFVSRNRGWVSAILAVCASLVIGLAVATYGLIVANQKRIEAEQESIRSKRVVDALNEMLGSADPAMGRGIDYTVRAMLDEFADSITGRFDDDPHVAASVRHTIGKAYFNLGLAAAAEPHLRTALDLHAMGNGDQLDEAQILTDLAAALLLAPQAGRNLGEAENAVRKAIAIYRQHDTASSEHANSLCVLGWILYNKSGGDATYGRSDDESVTVTRQGIRIVEGGTDKRSLTVKGRLFVGLAIELQRHNDRAALHEAMNLAEEGLALLEAQSPYDHFMRLALLANGMCQIHMGRADEAENSFLRAKTFEERTKGIMGHDTLHMLLSAMFMQGKVSHALDLATSSIPQTSAPFHPMHVRNQSVVGSFLLGLGALERAEQQVNSALEESVVHLGPEHLATIEAQFRLAQALFQQDDGAKQARVQEIATGLLPICRAAAQAGSEPFSHAYTFIVGHLKSPTSADVLLAGDVNRRVLGQPLTPLLRLRNLYAGALVKIHSSDTEGAKDFLQEIIESPVAYSWHPGPGDLPFFVLRNAEDALARVLLESGDQAAAARVYRRSIVRCEEAERPDHYQITFAKQRLATFLAEQDNHEEARQLLTEAKVDLADAPKCFDWLRERVDEDIMGLQLPEASGRP